MIKLLCKWCGQQVKARDVETAARGKCPLCAKELLVEFSTVSASSRSEDLPEVMLEGAQRSTNWLRWAFAALVVLALVAFAVTIWYYERVSVPTNPSGEAVSVSAVQLQREYKANKEAADANYKGQRLRVTGVIKDSGRNLLGQPYVAFETEGDRLGFSAVKCYFASEHTPDLTPLAKGKHAAVEGVCTGNSLTDIELKECQLLWSN